MAKRTSYTNEDPQQLSYRYLANYTLAEGQAEDIAYAYLRAAPLEVVEPLLARRPWPSDSIRQMLVAVIARESPPYPKDLVWFRDKFGCEFDLVSEWKRATLVRNDLAHTQGNWVHYLGEEGREQGVTNEDYPDLWELYPRTKRHTLRVLAQRFDVDVLAKEGVRLGGLMNGLWHLAAHLGIISYNGYKGPGPKPHTPDPWN